MLHAKLMALYFIKPELLLIKVLHCGIGIFDFCCFCELDLDPLTFKDEHDQYYLEIYRMCKYEVPTLKAFETYRLTDRQTHRQTDRTEIYQKLL